MLGVYYLKEYSTEEEREDLHLPRNQIHYI